MSVANDKITTMELRQKCKELSDFFLPIYEDYWATGGREFSDEAVEFSLYTESLGFYIAFSVEHGMVSVDGLTDKGIEEINHTHDLMVEGIR